MSAGAPIGMAFVFGVLGGVVAVPLLLTLFRAVTVLVEDEHEVLVTRFGKLAGRLTTPGLHWVWDRAMPWVTLRPVSLQRDFRHFRNVHVNDARGTTVIVDLWLEFRIVDAARAHFQVADWDRSLQNLVAHAATSILCNREFREILCDRTELGARLQHDIRGEMSRWGLEVESVYIRNVMLLAEVARQIETTIAARLERARADIEESGRLAVAQLEAETSVRVARLVAEAKGQYPAAVGRALARLATRAEVLAAYTELYELSLVRPHRTITFRGFAHGEVRTTDAAMMVPPLGEPSAPLPPLPAAPDERWSSSRPSPVAHPTTAHALADQPFADQPFADQPFADQPFDGRSAGGGVIW